MSKTKPKNKRAKRPRQYAKRVSLYPLTVSQAIRALAPVRSNGSNGESARNGNGS